MKKGLNLPIIIDDIPPEIEGEINEKLKKEKLWLVQRELRIKKSFFNKSSLLSRVGNFLLENFLKSFSYEELAEQFKTSEGCIRVIISDLSFWTDFPLKFISPRRKGYFQSALKDLKKTDEWMITQSRTIASKQQRLDNTEIVHKVAKRKVKPKQKVKKKVNIPETH